MLIMAKASKKKASKIKVKKKIWYKVLSSKVFGSREVGESYLASPESAVGRVLKINLRDITGNVRDQNVYLGFQISGVDGTTLKTSLISYQIVPTHIKRIVRKNIDRLDDVMTLKTKDGASVILKSLTITIHKTQRSTRSAVRKLLQELFQEELEKADFDTFVSNLVSYKIQSTIKKRLAKIYPLKEVAVRVLTLKRKNIASKVEKAKVKEVRQLPVSSGQEEVPKSVPA
jgi:ribosomal protein S3AE